MSEGHRLPAMLLRTLQQERNNANEILKMIIQSSYTDNLEYVAFPPFWWGKKVKDIMFAVFKTLII